MCQFILHRAMRLRLQAIHPYLLLVWPLFLFLLPNPPAALAQTASPTDVSTRPDFTEVRKYIKSQMAEQSIPSVVVAVARNKEIIWEQGFGVADRIAGTVATPKTPYYLASVTKAITGTAILVLNESGKIDLDHPVNDYLGSAKVHSPMWDSSTATIRRVASHTAGLTTYTRKCSVDDLQCRASPETAINRYGVLFWPPGDHFDYSNLGYGILGQVVAQSSGKNFATFLHDDIFEPLGMKNCSLGLSPEFQKKIAAQYDSTSHKRTPRQLSDTPGASSVYCSADDLVLFGLFALKAHLPTQRQILSDASLDEMLNPTVKSDDGESYGFGWSLQSDFYGFRGVYAQGGTNDSFAVLQTIPREGIVVAVITNTGTALPSEIVNRILSEMLPTFRKNLSEKTTPTNDGSGSPQKNIPNAVAGIWTGYIQTWKKRIPLLLSISPSSGIRAKIGLRPKTWEKVANVDISDSRFYAVVPGNLETPDGPTPPYHIEIELYLRGDHFVGAATTKDGPQLPYWTELRRSP